MEKRRWRGEKPPKNTMLTTFQTFGGCRYPCPPSPIRAKFGVLLHPYTNGLRLQATCRKIPSSLIQTCGHGSSPDLNPVEAYYRIWGVICSRSYTQYRPRKWTSCVSDLLRNGLDNAWWIMRLISGEKTRRMYKRRRHGVMICMRVCRKTGSV